MRYFSADERYIEGSGYRTVDSCLDMEVDSLNYFRGKIYLSDKERMEKNA